MRGHAETRVEVDTQVTKNGGRGNSGRPHAERNLWKTMICETMQIAVNSVINWSFSIYMLSVVFNDTGWKECVWTVFAMYVSIGECVIVCWCTEDSESDASEDSASDNIPTVDRSVIDVIYWL